MKMGNGDNNNFVGLCCIDEAIRKVIQAKPENGMAHYQMGNVLVKMERIDEAIDSYRGAVRTRPDFSDAHANLATALTQKGDVAGAINHFKLALRSEPGSA